MKTRNELSRRGFLQQAATLALAGGTIGLAQPNRAAEQGPHWVVACRDIHLRAAGQADCWSAMKALGVQGVEVEPNAQMDCPTLFHPDKKYRIDTRANVQVLQEDLAAHGLVITSFLMHNQLDRRLEQEVAWARQLVAAAQQLHIKAIRIDVVPHVLKREQFLPFAIKACKQLCEPAEGTAVSFGVENHGNTTNDPQFLTQLFDGVGSAHLGLTLDVGNFYWYGHPLEQLYALYEQFGPRAKHTHCKNIHYPEDRRNVRRPMGWGYEQYDCPIYDGDIDYRRLLNILRQAHYAGDLCIEDEALGKFPADQRAGILHKEAAYLAELQSA